MFQPVNEINIARKRFLPIIVAKIIGIIILEQNGPRGIFVSKQGNGFLCRCLQVPEADDISVGLHRV